MEQYELQVLPTRIFLGDQEIKIIIENRLPPVDKEGYEQEIKRVEGIKRSDIPRYGYALALHHLQRIYFWCSKEENVLFMLEFGDNRSKLRELGLWRWDYRLRARYGSNRVLFFWPSDFPAPLNGYDNPPKVNVISLFGTTTERLAIIDNFCYKVHNIWVHFEKTRKSHNHEIREKVFFIHLLPLPIEVCQLILRETFPLL
jgi:hypothetical protein